MALPALATVPQLAAWLGETIAEADARALAVLSSASTLVREYTGSTWEDGELPDAINAVTLAVAGRAWARSGDVVQSLEQAGPFQLQSRYGGDGGGLYLTATDKLMLRAYRASRTAVGVLSTTRGEECLHTLYVPVVGTSNLFPWYDPDDPLLQ